jgi:Tfp pilus assembly protein PilF
VPSWLALAQTHITKRDPDAARTDLQKALALDSGNAEAQRLMRAMPK